MKEIIALLILCCTSSALIAQRGCTVNKDEFKPVIATLNPFFTDHQWDSYRYTEKARLDVHRSLLIAQTGCRRHHVTIIFSLAPDAVPTSAHVDFFIQEALTVMNMVYWEDNHYATYKKKFEERFIAGLTKTGIGKEFNFPIGTSTFICGVRTDPKLGTRITIEQATYVFAENVLQKKNLTPRAKDDGWFKQEN
jgi:hypothetical protein